MTLDKIRSRLERDPREQVRSMNLAALDAGACATV
jgi:hypothetical protein